MPLTTTLCRIRDHKPCRKGWEKLLKGLNKTREDDEPLPYSKIVEINGLDDALWCCRVEPQEWRTWRLFAIWCARQVAHLVTDPRSVEAIDVAERHANGTATDEELSEARAAARAAARTAAWDAVRAAAARAAAGAAAVDAVRDAAVDAVRDAAGAAAWAAAVDAAVDAAWAAATDRQRAKFIEMVDATEASKS